MDNKLAVIELTRKSFMIRTKQIEEDHEMICKVEKTINSKGVNVLRNISSAHKKFDWLKKKYDELDRCFRLLLD